MKPCPDCGTAPGELHVFGCDVERCPECGLQFISCGCFDDCDDGEDIPGRLPWTGEWPDLAQCREYGLWCKRNPDGPGWIACNKDDPGATEDLNRLVVECDWDKKACKWVRKQTRRNGRSPT
jgi:hypothetical protein